MSFTEVGSLTALSSNQINVPSGHVILGEAGSIVTPGSVIQTAFSRTDVRTSYYNYTQADYVQSWTPIRQLQLRIKPLYANSAIFVKFIVNYEMEYNTVWNLLKDEQPFITTMNESYPRRWAGMCASNYDMSDHSSTPNQLTMMWVDMPGSTQAQSYSPGFRRADGGGVTCWLNRTYSSSGQDSYEVGVSYGVAMEIAQ